MKKIIISEATFRSLFVESQAYGKTYMDGDDIWGDLQKYFSYMKYDQNNPNVSKEAAYIHRSLMDSLHLCHDYDDDFDEEDIKMTDNQRNMFQRILSYIKGIAKDVGIKSIIVTNNATWVVNLNNDYEIEIDGFDFDEPMDKNYRCGDYGIAFITNKGVDVLEYNNDDSGSIVNLGNAYHAEKVKMDDEMKQKIYAMGLIPCIVDMGSYHLSDLYSVGVLPSMYSTLKNYYENESGIYDYTYFFADEI